MVQNTNVIVRAKAKTLKVSPQKLNLVADLVRGQKVSEAIMQLIFCKKKAASCVNKLLKSALASAQHNYNLDVDNLYIKEILVGKSITLRRVFPKAMGRANRINKRYSNMVVKLMERV